MVLLTTLKDIKQDSYKYRRGLMSEKDYRIKLIIAAAVCSNYTLSQIAEAFGNLDNEGGDG